MRIALVIILFCSFPRAFAHAPTASPGRFVCEAVLEAGRPAEESRIQLAKLFGPQEELRPRAKLSPGDRLVLGWFEAAVENWVKLSAEKRATDDYQKLMFKVIESALTRHFPRVWNGKMSEPRDLTRLGLILQEIGKLTPDNFEFGLFKVQRLVEGRYSLEQFAQCR